MKKKQSSIELFAIALYEKGFLKGNGNDINDLLEEHKAMHKEEVVKAFDEGQECEYQVHINSAPKYDSETYYNETYTNEK